MKPYSLFTIVLLVSYNLSAQIYEPYNYELVSYIDNMPQQIIPELFQNAYYQYLDLLDYKGSIVIDEANKRTDLHVRSKKAKDGYLYVNSQIMNHITIQDLDLDKIKVSYVYNSVAVTSEKNVMRVLRLRKRRINSSVILYDEPKGLITVFICTY